MKKSQAWLPFVFALLLAGGIYTGMKLSEPFNEKQSFFTFRTNQFNKISEVINYVNQEYVDTVNEKQLVDKTIEVMLHTLDPHSAYIPSEEVQAMNEPLEGNFEGIGIEFHIQQDTIMVVSAIAGGPSQSLGIRSGDRIIRVDGKNTAGIGITNVQVMQLLRGPRNTKVTVSILRKGNSSLVDYTITRDKIPIYSVDVGYLLSASTGYIKISHFAEKTYDEFLKAFLKLKNLGMSNLILDLRGNPGGYLKTAIQLADEFLDEGKLIVYTEGRSKPRSKFHATAKGYFSNGNLVVLIDEGSASASEIVAGALQDWDRAVIVGRRSFGKGLVQEQSYLPDGSAVRLTISRYFTPTGRSIQKPYKEGYEHYASELLARNSKGELLSADSIHFPDSLRFKTPAGKIVYGGGGIMPDIFVPLDTSGFSTFYMNTSSKGLIAQFAYDYVDKHRLMLEKFDDVNEFQKDFHITHALYHDFIVYAYANQVEKDAAGEQVSADIIKTQLKALIARQLWKNEGFYPIIHQVDETLKKAKTIIESNNKPAVLQAAKNR